MEITPHLTDFCLLFLVLTIALVKSIQYVCMLPENGNLKAKLHFSLQQVKPAFPIVLGAYSPMLLRLTFPSDLVRKLLCPEVRAQSLLDWQAAETADQRNFLIR